MSFPNNFTWGVASAAYQNEGAVREDGRGETIWDVYCRRKGVIAGGHTGEIACDSYHLYPQDVALMKELGVKAYRLSLAWSRILPSGTGTVNLRGIDFYHRLFDALLQAGIEPWVTLFHWDYPYALFCRGGWLNPESSNWFAEYAAVVAGSFSDRVTHWITLNEPQVFLEAGHHQGVTAPGLKLAMQEMLQAGHHVLLAHGKGVQALRANAKQPLKIGWAPVGETRIPASEKPEDIDAACRAFHGVRSENGWNNSWWIGPVYLGRYPDAGLQAYGQDIPQVKTGEMETICQPLDFCGANLYCALTVRAGVDGEPEIVPPPPGHPKTAAGDWFHVTPPTIYWACKWLYERYHQPIVITENGYPAFDSVSLDGKVHDPQRINYLQRYLLQVAKTIDAGTPVDGYFLWTLMDNFEWTCGYDVRVGLVYTDFSSLARIPKDSYYWYQQVIASNGESTLRW